MNADLRLSAFSRRFHQGNKTLEMMFGVVWAGSGLGVVLDRDYGQGAMAHALNTLIVEINVRDFNFRRQSLRTYRKSVVV